MLQLEADRAHCKFLVAIDAPGNGLPFLCATHGLWPLSQQNAAGIVLNAQEHGIVLWLVQK